VQRAEIGPYRILRLLKEGGGGRVYVALDQRLNRRVALKFISKPQAGEAREILISEARALASLNHRCIVQIFDVVEVRAYIILVMEYVPGTDLDDLSNRVQLDSLAVLQLALDLGAALTAAHQKGIVHRDVKPANVLLAPTGHIKLTDFGISSTATIVAEDRTLAAEKKIAGSYLSMSPEHVSGGQVDQRSDLFALGLLLYRMSAGRHPLAGENGLITVQQILYKQQLPLQDLNHATLPRFSDLVEQLLRKDARERPKSALVVRQEALAILRELPLTRGKPLARFMAGAARTEDAVETTVKLPTNVGRAARSHLLTTGEWGPWAAVPLFAWHRPALILVSLSLLMLGVFGLELWQQSRVTEVSVRGPAVMLEANGRLAPDANQLRGLLERAVERQENTVLGADSGAEVLELQVNCNAHICGLLLRREGTEEMLSGYATLLPGAPYAAWQASINTVLAELFKAG
jgi:hypothetical protein